MMNANLLFVVSCLSFLACCGHSEFVGELELEPPGCTQTPKCTLGADIGFVDSRGVGWLAAAGNETDGASIPRFAQIFVGVPFEPRALRAAVLHDHYSATQRPVRGWFETQRMFYEALLAGGVQEPRASIMYAGVLLGSRRWITREVGRPCEIGPICINQVVDVTLETQAETYGTAAFIERFEAVTREIETGIEGGRAVETLVRDMLLDDVFLQHPSGVIREGLIFSPR